MVAVEQEEDAFLPRAGRLVMEQEAVQGLLSRVPLRPIDWWFVYLSG